MILVQNNSYCTRRVCSDKSGTKQNKMPVLNSGLALVILWPADGKLGFFQTSQD